MIIYPAIDLRDGKVVRLREGDPNAQTIFSDNPVQTAERWHKDGASWIHVVNLDGAFEDANDNLSVLAEIAKLNVNIQFGGGMRSLSDVEQALTLGASRVILGTLAIQQPDIVRQAINQFGADAICVALDARDGKITTHGWAVTTDETPLSLGKAMAEAGLIHALYTDIRRDGGLTGANIEDTIQLGRETGLSVIASGGVSQIEELRQLAKSGVVGGAIIGMALYKGLISLPEALTVANAN